jgi:tRNA-specific adenosine deaminase 1
MAPRHPDGGAGAVVAAALAAFRTLPKGGKPQAHEHTVLAAIAVTLPPGGRGGPRGERGPFVVALATGTKCLPHSRRAPDGSALNDCHAEPLARRALLRWLYAEVAAAAASPAGATAVLRIEAAAADGSAAPRVRVQPGVQLHMFVSHPPCGDASVHAGCTVADDDEAAGAGAGAAGLPPGRTGAKPLQPSPAPGAPPAALPQPRDVESYAAPQAVGVARRKPGRGEPTLSMSCSDKLARWALLGVQGSLLGALLADPLYLDTLTVGCHPSAVADTQEALRRAVGGRAAGLAPRLAPPFAHAPPAARAVPVARAEAAALGLAAGGERRVASGNCVAWWAAASPAWRLKPARPPAGGAADGAQVLTGGTVEALTGLTGCRTGWGRAGSQAVGAGARSGLCKAALGGQFAAAWAALRGGATEPGDPSDAAAPPAVLLYGAAKLDAGAEYQAAWRQLLEAPSPFEAWIPKPPGAEGFALAASDPTQPQHLPHPSEQTR